MKSNKTYCAALLKRTKLNAAAAISQLTIAFHRHLTGFIANWRAGEGRALARPTQQVKSKFSR